MRNSDTARRGLSFKTSLSFDVADTVCLDCSSVLRWVVTAMASRHSYIDSLTAAIAGLFFPKADHSESTNTTVTSIQAKKPDTKKLMSLPNEILEQIIKATIEDEVLRFHITTGLKDSDSPETVLKSEWNLTWVPDLRLVSVALRALVSPTIAEHVEVWFWREGIETLLRSEVLPGTWLLAKFCPKYILSRVKTIKVSAFPLSEEVESVDVSGFDNLMSLELGPYDAVDSVNINSMKSHIEEERRLNYMRGQVVALAHKVQLWQPASFHALCSLLSPPSNFLPPEKSHDDRIKMLSYLERILWDKAVNKFRGLSGTTTIKFGIIEHDEQVQAIVSLRS